MEQAKSAGFATGNVSTAEITDATPVAQMSHALLRGCQGPVYLSFGDAPLIYRTGCLLMMETRLNALMVIATQITAEIWSSVRT